MFLVSQTCRTHVNNTIKTDLIGCFLLSQVGDLVRAKRKVNKRGMFNVVRKISETYTSSYLHVIYN